MIEAMRSTRYPEENSGSHGMFIVLMLTCVVSVLDRQVFSVVIPSVQLALAMSAQQFSTSYVALYFGAGLSALPAAWLAGRVQRKLLVIGGLALFSIGTGLVAYVQNVPQYIALRFLTGIGIGVHLVAVLAIGMANFPKNRALVAGAFTFTFGIGAALGPNLGGVVFHAYGWRILHTVLGLTALPATFLVVWLVKPAFTEKNRGDAFKSPGDTRHRTTQVRRSTHLLLPTAAVILLSFAVYGYLLQYVPYLQESQRFPPSLANVAVGAYGFGTLFALHGGWLGHTYGSRRTLIGGFVAAAIVGGALFGGLSGSPTFHIMMSAVFGVVIGAGAYVNLLTWMSESLAPSRESWAIGLFFSSFYLPVPLVAYVFGALKEHCGWTVAGLLIVSGLSLCAALLVSVAPTSRSVLPVQ
ncbi:MULTISPECIES: MFS transporter [Paraburkholderia]|uniref:MFS transporter n=1 Tax=Paraburkholderia TaxID=1822464 RepID=UPI0022554C11|nr:MULTISPECIES: MFS transporter [Paraburkholderia]MCX4162332.1 MFS transporter [Paraburkholderia megapolitana]MDN7157827.1 MFS transporter [Paraburkholderia sp. CHISQ3]MDQ6494874.1 MFS transporter [Paraburkholderia megapolitana]